MSARTGKDWAFKVLVVLVSVAFIAVLLPFYGALLWAVILALLFDPLQQWLLRILHGRQNLAAAASVLVCVCLVVIPGTVLLSVLAQDATEFYQRVSDRQIDPSEMLQRAQAALPDSLASLLGSVESLQQRLTSAAAESARTVASHLVSIGQGTARMIISIGLMVYVLFFLFRDGGRLVAMIQRASPLGDQHTSYLLQKFAQVVKATVKGNFIIALIQGALGGIAFQLLGIGGALLWGVVMAALSLLPAIGAALVWTPVAVYLLLTGSYVRGLILLGIGVLVIGMIDNFLRPVLVGKDIKLPDYLVLVSTLGGLAVFGMNGFILGPLIAALFVAVWALREEGRVEGRPGT